MIFTPTFIFSDMLTNWLLISGSPTCSHLSLFSTVSGIDAGVISCGLRHPLADNATNISMIRIVYLFILSSYLVYPCTHASNEYLMDFKYFYMNTNCAVSYTHLTLPTKR